MRELAGVAAVTALLGAVVHGRHAPVPSLTVGGLTSAPVVAVLALLPAVAFLYSYGGVVAVSVTAVRRVGLYWRISALLLVATVSLLACALAGVGAGLELARDTAGLLGLALVGRRLAGDHGALVLSFGYLVAAFLLGRQPSGDPALWAWILADSGSVPAGLLGAGLMLIGLALGGNQQAEA